MTVDRDAVLTYGALAIGGSSETLLLDQEPDVVAGPDDATLSCTFVVRASTPAAFQALLDTVYAQLRTPRAALSLVIDGVTRFSWDPAAGTGFDIVPQFVSPGDPTVDSDRSLRVNASFQVLLPADTYADGQQRDSSITVSYTPSRVTTFTISGEYRAGATYSTGWAAYQAGIAGDVTAAIAAIGGGNFDLTSEQPVQLNDTNTVATFSRTYKQVIKNQGVGVLDHAAIVEPSLQLSKATENPGDTLRNPLTGAAVQISRPDDVTATWSCGIDHTEVSTTAGMTSLWRTVIRPRILEAARQAWGGSGVAVISEQVTPEIYDSTLDATVVLRIVSGSGLLAYKASVKIDEASQETEEEIGHPDPYARLVYPSPGRRIRTVTETWTEREKGGAGRRNVPGGVGGVGGVAFNFGNRNRGRATSRPLFALGSNGGGGGEGRKNMPAANRRAGGGKLGPHEWGSPQTSDTSEPSTWGAPPNQIPTVDRIRVTIQSWRAAWLGRGQTYQQPITPGG